MRILNSPRYCDNDERLELWRALTPLVKWEGEASRMILSQETCLRLHDSSREEDTVIWVINKIGINGTYYRDVLFL